MRSSRIYLVAGMAFLLGSLLLLSCQPSQPVATPKPAEKAAAAATKPAAQAAEKPVRGGTLRVAIDREFGSLDPNTITAQPGMFPLYEYTRI